MGNMPGHIPAAGGRGQEVLFPSCPLPCRISALRGRGGSWMQGHPQYWDGVSWTPRPRTGEVGVGKAHRGISSAGAIIINVVLEARFLSWLWSWVGVELGGLPSCAWSKEPLHEEPQNRSAATWLGSESGGI